MKVRGLWLLALLLSAQVSGAAERIWLDVRSAEEFAQGHLPGALNVPYLEVGTRIRQITQDPDTEIRLYCAVGGRAQIAKVWLQSLGYRNVTNEGSLEDARKQLAVLPAATECQIQHNDETPLEEEKSC
jgi:phage shock protein E